jgi:hypothetical protein
VRLGELKQAEYVMTYELDMYYLVNLNKLKMLF